MNEKAITYIINGCRFLEFKGQDKIDNMKKDLSEKENIEQRVRCWYMNPFIEITGKKELEDTINSIKDVDIKSLDCPSNTFRNELPYLEHPYRNNYYIPVHEYNIFLQKEKRSELIKLLGSLGARKIDFISTIEESEQKLNKIYSYLVRNNIILNDSNNLTIEFEGEISKEPITGCWYKTEPEWSTLVELRQINKIKKYSMSYTNTINTQIITTIEDDKFPLKFKSSIEKIHTYNVNISFI
jgi:hypothetical protein